MSEARAVSGSIEEDGMSSEGHYRQRLSTIAENWRALALRGLVSLVFGLLILLWPGLVLSALALLFGIYALADGATILVPALRVSDRGVRRWLPLSEGTVGVIAGLVSVLWSGRTVSGLLYVIAAWALLTGILKILTTIVLRSEVDTGWLLAGSGALSVLFGAILAALVRADLSSVAPLIGAFAVVVGLALIVFALRMRMRVRT
jgi:uncharacterized membrane protein HdeD (DUF308 family)